MDGERRTIGRHPARPSGILRLFLVLPAALSLLGCGGGPGDSPGADYELDPQLVFWEELQSLCGQAFSGRLVEVGPASDTNFREAGPIVLRASSCDVAEVRFDVHVGADQSRQWVVTPTAVGLRLSHERRRDDGSEEQRSGYGGETYGPGTETTQRFPVDPPSLAVLGEDPGLTWTLQLHPDSVFVYEVGREDRKDRVRVEFDLGDPLPRG